MHLTQLQRNLLRLHVATQVFIDPLHHVRCQRSIATGGTAAHESLVLPQLGSFTQKVIAELIEAGDQCSPGTIRTQSQIDFVKWTTGSRSTDHLGDRLQVLGPENPLRLSIRCGSETVMNQNQIEITGVSHLVSAQPTQSEDGMACRVFRIDLQIPH